METQTRKYNEEEEGHSKTSVNSIIARSDVRLTQRKEEATKQNGGVCHHLA
jgi:hypothetical protein